jgi:hypothetical protein
MRQGACVVIFVATLLWPMVASAQDTTGPPCAFATDAAALILDPEQVGVGFSEDFVPSPGHVADMPPGWLSWVMRGFRNGPVRVLQVVNTFDGPESAALFAAHEVQTQRAAVRCGAFVVEMGATFEREMAEQPPRLFGVDSLAWALLGTVTGGPTDCVVTQGLGNGWLVATCNDGSARMYNPESGQWIA